MARANARFVLASIEPYFLELLSVVITAMLGVAVAFAKDRFGLEIEARHREALHSALMTGARLALSRMGAHGANSAPCRSMVKKILRLKIF